jgi:SAM-dependent methyltransferase
MRVMHFLFATAAPLRQGQGGPTSDLASARYRVLIPATQLARLGHQVQVGSPGPAGWPAEVTGARCDALVISKSFDAVNEGLARSMKSRGVRVVADFCDDHFAHPQLGPHFRNLAALADTVVSATPAMAEAVRAATGRESVVVSDPVEGPRGAPRFAPRLPALQVVWFGHPSNLNGLLARASELHALARRMPVRLTVVTTASPEVAAAVASLARGQDERVQARLVAWSVEATWKALAEADLAWIPVEESAAKAVKSPNRMLEAIWAGRPVVAGAMPGYLLFADLMPVGQSLEEGATALLADPPAVVKRVAQAQRRIAREHSAYACGLSWARVLGDDAQRPLRLNLGCGDKILPGYVNVDVVEARAGMRPDVICDLHDLAPFDDASADEILSVHVVEHFWRWEVREVIREWARVLKPGGRMVVECPNIRSACETFLQDPERFSREDQEGQRTMWVFYGDPKWKDPLMIHRWGYTPESLKALLAEAGLREVRQEPAQFKLREPRDMRVVGVKP